MRRVSFVFWPFVVVLAAVATVRAPDLLAEDAPSKPEGDDEKEKEKEKEDAEKAKAERERDEKRGYIGITYGLAQKLSADDRKELGITVEKGLVIQHVMLDGPAMFAGVKIGDVPVSLNGAAVPDGKDLATDDETWKKFQNEKLKPLFVNINPGEKSKVVVDRGGKPMTFEITTINFEEKEKLAKLDEEDRIATKPPKLDGRGAPRAAGFTFEEELPEGKDAPKDLLQMTGFWEVKEDPSKPGNRVLSEGSDFGDVYNVGLLIGDGHVYTDGTASMRFSLQKEQGERSKSAGIVVRCQDRRHYYALRVDGVTQTVAIVKINKDEQTVLAKKKIESPKLGSWHKFAVSFKGKALEATYDDTTTVTVNDDSYPTGWVGLASFADAVTFFDDFVVAPADSAPPGPPAPGPTPTK